MTRKRRQPDRLAGGGGKLIDVDEALAEWDDGMEFSQDAEEDQDEWLEERGGRAAKAARRGGALAEPKPLHPLAVSDLLAAAPHLVDLLLQEDKVRCITLVARDICNLEIAGGGRICVAPFWSAMATRLRLKRAAEAEAEQLAEGEARLPADVAATAPGEAAPQQLPAETEVPAVRKGCKARRARGRQPRPPPPPSDLDRVRAAVASDPARENRVRKTTEKWRFHLSDRDLQGVEQRRTRYVTVRELDVRAAAHRKWGDEAQMEAVERASARRAEEWQAAQRKRAEEELAGRKEQLALLVAQEGLPACLAERPLSHGRTSSHYQLDDWLSFGPFFGEQLSLNEMLGPIATAHREKTGQEERTRLLDEALAEHGHLFFKRDWRYRCFIASGVADGLPALLALAARQAAARQEALERERELDERLDAVGLRRCNVEFGPEITAWLHTGEGDIEALVDRARASSDRELELWETLRAYGLLYYLRDSRCRRYVSRPQLGQTATQVAQSLLEEVNGQHERLLKLQHRLYEERLPASSLKYSACRDYLESGGSLTETICEVRAWLYRLAYLTEPPPQRRRLAEGGGRGGNCRGDTHLLRWRLSH
ncbi:hypothetical protein ABPG77_005246 [Micractinium sp. CCAP 211/92]